MIYRKLILSIVVIVTLGAISCSKIFDSLIEETDTETEESELLGEFSFITGAEQDKPSDVAMGISISPISVGKLNAEYSDDALKLSDWTWLNIAGGKRFGFEINNQPGYSFEVDSITVVLRRSDNQANNVRLNYGSDKPNTTQYQWKTVVIGSSVYETYTLKPDTGKVPDQNTPFFAFGVSAGDTETVVEFDKIQIYGRVFEATAEVVVKAGSPIHPIHPHFWGTNLLHWIDDDASLQDGKVADSLGDMGLQVLRYPGGTVADNYHWETNTLANINMFPYESGDAETDFDEFMAQCIEIGAEPSCVLNTETWVVNDDIEGGAHEAANWLRYCKSKGYDVKYWEVGNETYWHPVLSAREYADLVNVYADSLRAVDPNVVIGINGHWNIDFVSTKERIKPEAYDQLMEYRKNIDSRDARTQYKDFQEENTLLPVTQGDVKWWETVAAYCGANVDMVIIHWYFTPGQLPNVANKLLEVRSLFSQEHPNKTYLFNMNEYNVTSRTDESHMHLTEMLGAMLKGKIDMTSYWPMRMQYSDKPRLLNYGTGQHSIMFEIHKFLAQHLKGALVETEAPYFIPTFSSHGEGRSVVVMTGSKLTELASVDISVVGGSATSCSVWRINGSEFDHHQSQENVTVNNQQATVTVKPGEVVVAVFE